MPDYRVRWEIDVIANSPLQAAVIALEIAQDPGAVFSRVFEVAPRLDEGSEEGPVFGAFTEINLGEN